MYKSKYLFDDFKVRAVQKAIPQNDMEILQKTVLQNDAKMMKKHNKETKH